MTDLELKQLKDRLWNAVDKLRAGAHLAANKYGQPILGLIFLRYADILFKQHKEEIDAEYNKYKGGRMEKSIKEIAIEKAKVKSAIEVSLNEDIPESYDSESFRSKIDLLMNHFIDMAVQGYGWVGRVA